MSPDIRGRCLRLFLLVGPCLLAPAALAGDPLYPQPHGDAQQLVFFLAPLDADSDGITDFAVAGPYTGEVNLVSVFFGSEPMAFVTPVMLPLVGTSLAKDLTTGDVDGDGDDDVALLDTFRLSLGLSDGQGGFTVEATELALPGAVLAPGDMDADGDLDFVIGGASSLAGSYVLFRGADGTYTAGPVLASNSDSRAVCIADLDADGVLDYALGQAGGGGHVVLVRGTGGGSFSISTTTSAPGLRDLTLAHIDSDGLSDVAWVGGASPNAATQLGQPGGALGPVVPVINPSLGPVERVSAGDLDEDGDDDLLLDTSIFLWIAQTTGGLATVQPIDPIPDDTDLHSSALVDADGDGRLDIVASVMGRLHLVRGLDGLDLELPVASPLPPNPSADCAAGDLDLDGSSDLVLGHGFVARVLPGHVDGSFGPVLVSQAIASVGTWYPRAVADFDGDGLPDVAGTVDSSAVPNPRGVNVLRGQGDGTLLLAGLKTPTEELVSHAVPTDFDLDGDLDLAALTPDQLLVMLGSGSGVFSVEAIGLPGSPDDVAVGDVDANGWPDVILPFEDLDRLEVRLGLGGTLGPPTDVPVADPVSVKAGDFDGDGRADLAVGRLQLSPSSTDLTVLQSLPGGWATVATVSCCADFSYSPTEVVAFADATGDGLPDVLGVNFGQLGVLAPDGLGGFAPMCHFRVPYDAPISLDVNADGRADVVTVLGADDWSPPNAIRTALAGHITPWSNVGHGLAGVKGEPRLMGHGDLVAGQPCAIDLIKAAASAPALLVAGGSPALEPLKHGTLVPTPDVIVFLATGASGDLHIELTWPGGVPSHSDFFLQAWVKDRAASAGWASSNGLRGVVP